MKKQSMLNLFITIAGSLLLLSCSNNKAANAETNKASKTDTAELTAITVTATPAILNDSVVVNGKTVKKDHEENEAHEKKEKDEKD